MANNIKLLEYSAEWADLYKAEEEKLRQLPGDFCTDIHHIGATSVVGAPSRPVIDILLIAKEELSPESYLEQIMSLGYSPVGRDDFDGSIFERTEGDFGYNLFVVASSDEFDIERLLRVPEFLRNNPQVAETYFADKRLASEDENGYFDKNSELLDSIEDKALGVETTVSEAAEASAEPEVEAPAEPKVEAPAEPEAEVPAEPEVEAPAEPEVEAPAEPKVEAPAEPKVEAPAEPKVEAPAEPKVEAPAEPKVEAPAEPKVEAPAEPEAEAPAEPEVEAPAAKPSLWESVKTKSKSKPIKEEPVEDKNIEETPAKVKPVKFSLDNKPQKEKKVKEPKEKKARDPKEKKPKAARRVRKNHGSVSVGICFGATVGFAVGMLLGAGMIGAVVGGIAGFVIGIGIGIFNL